MSGRLFANIKAEFDPKDPGAVGAALVVAKREGLVDMNIYNKK